MGGLQVLAGVNQMQCVLNGLVKCILQLGHR